MRATMRTMWLLLSLSFLFHSICSDDVSPTSTLKGSDSTSVTTNKPTRKLTTPAPTFTKPTTAVSTATTTMSTSKAIYVQHSTQPQTITVKYNSSGSNSNISDSALSTASATTSQLNTTSLLNTTSQLNTISPPITIDSNDSPGGSQSSSAAPTQKPGTSVPSIISRTEASYKPDNTEPTTITKGSTVTRTPGQQSMTYTVITSTLSQNSIGGKLTTNPNQERRVTITPTNSQEDSKGVTGQTAVRDPSLGMTTQRVPEPTGNTMTTSSPSALTKTGGFPTAETTKAVTVSLQTTITTTTAEAQLKTFVCFLINGHMKEEDKDKQLVRLCRQLMVNLQDGKCSLTWRLRDDKTVFVSVEIKGNVNVDLANQYYEEITKKPTDNKTLIAILASCGALLIMIVLLAVCASHHRKPYNENQQHLTEELHTVENGYHDNPTLEVMEVQPEMQEKKTALNGEFNDSWIVPFDNLLKDIPDEEDTHL